jgi:hypothetical protein
VDEILMAASAELGPLDVQIEHPHREGEIVSGLDVANSLDFLGTTAINLILSGGASVRKYTGLPRSEVLVDLTNFAAQLLQPAVQKLDLHLTHRADNQLRVAEQYAERLLRMRNVSSSKHLKNIDGQTFVRKLIEEYPAHEFVISRDEARGLGLHIGEAEQHPHWGVIKRFHNETIGRTTVLVLADTTLMDVLSGASSVNDQTVANDGEVKPNGKDTTNEDGVPKPPPPTAN